MPQTKTTADLEGKAPRLQKRGHFTTIDLPDYVAPQIREYLATRPEITFKQMVLRGLQQLGIEVRDEDLVSQRRRGLR